MRKNGYTLLEVSISMALLGIVSLLSFMALRSSTESASLSQAQAQVQGNLRDAMNEITSAVRQAYSQRTVTVVPPLAPVGAISIQVPTDGRSVSFQVPVPSGTPDMVAVSPRITIRYENEDIAGGTPNAVLDPGEDTNNDQLLTRRLVWTQAGTTRVVGGANDLSQVQFQLRPSLSGGNNLTTLYVFLESTKRYGVGEGKIIRAQTESTVYLEN